MHLQREHLDLFKYKKTNELKTILSVAMRSSPTTSSAIWLKWNSLPSYLASAIFEGSWLQIGFLQRIIKGHPSTKFTLLRCITPATLFTALIVACTHILFQSYEQAAHSKIPLGDLALEDCAISAKGVALLFSGMLIPLYLGSMRRFGEKWEYCATVYNEVFLKAKWPIHSHEQLLESQYKRAISAIDFLDCGLWHHRSFASEFNLAVENAYILDSFTARDLASRLERLRAGRLKRNEARDLLSQHISKIESLINGSRSMNDRGSCPRGM